jgi:hypothetical protein
MQEAAEGFGNRLLTGDLEIISFSDFIWPYAGYPVLQGGEECVLESICSNFVLYLV